ncbi:MAG: hypothetical protein KME10_22155 [Plectolyngbya sp. WJT66-NPBG17]|jgi:hypothetical protein|nr:hypothetical protein [Plectolyngbya sp. WJT66-NPBG17]
MIAKFRQRIALALLPAVLITLKPTEARSNPALVALLLVQRESGVLLLALFLLARLVISFGRARVLARCTTT